VLDHALETRQQALAIQEGLTNRMILPVALEVDFEAEDDEGSRYVWVVYTDNPDSSLERTSDLPYLAHYVTLAGEYLYSLPTIIPGDEASASGFDASYVFEFMEPADYTGYVDLSTGGELEISVTVMRDKRTGMYYLGNLERRIVGLVYGALYIAINWTTRGNAAGLPTWQSVLLFAGMVVMAVLHCIESQKLSKAFGKGTGFGVCLFLFGPIARLVLGFGNARYIGKAL